ncbi:hypothetical protein OQA88_5208 [Cercophora sp. LCS_1]
MGFSRLESLERICGTVGGGSGKLGEYARVFVVLLLCDVPNSIFGFFRNGLSDKAFPFRQGSEDGSLRPSSVCNTPERDFQLEWSDQCCDSFLTQQWRVLLPSFTGSVEHQDLEADTFMPWHDYHFRASGSSSTATAGGTNAPAGGHSEVSRVFIHDGHWSFDGLGPAPRGGRVRTFAVKRLRTTKEEDFKKEVAMLRELGGKKPHTVKLLATFRHGRTYCLLFPWAECDLLEYWSRDSSKGGKPPAPLIAWVAKQCHGIFAALHWIHDPKTILDPNDKELYGRHGDIKPENILWYKHNEDGPHRLASGELVLSDFGLSSLNHKNTRSNINNGDILHTTTYAPPESVLPRNVISRAIDIWALGCVYLEFITWIIGGPSKRGEFQTYRMSQFLTTTVNNDVFWELQEFQDPHSRTAQHVTVVKPKVERWIQSLRETQEATQYVQDFLDIIQNYMLVIKKSDRASVATLMPLFNKLKERCDRDPSYYTQASSIRRGAQVIQLPVVETLSIPARETISRGTAALPGYSEQAQPSQLQRSAATHLRPPAPG